jgi:phytoene desaturase
VKKIIIIGAGLGGLSAACRLAHDGQQVTVVERNENVGGKVNRVVSNGFKFDTGASLVTMKHVFEDLFEYCGRDITDYIEFEPLDPICRYFWRDGTVFDAAGDVEHAIGNVAETFPEDVTGFRRYLADSKRKYEIAERTFLAKSLNELPSLLKPSYLPDLFRISTLSSLDKHNSRYFKSFKLKQLLNRYATYNGSSPYKTPATFALIPWVEFGLGAWFPKGGIFEIPRQIEKLALELGVGFEFGNGVAKIEIEDGSANGVLLENGDRLTADVVVSNADAISTYRDLIPRKSRRIYRDKKLKKIEPSFSGFVLLLGTKRKFAELSHHNIFFSDDYRAEFKAIFEDGILPHDPTIYVCATSRSDSTQAPEGCENLFILINAPSLRKTETVTDYNGYGDFVISQLEKFGLSGLRESVVYRETITPADFASRYGANKGSIYGVSSNGIMSAFMRVPNMARDIRNLYFVGGTTHPGGGMPLVLLSGKMAAEMIG